MRTLEDLIRGMPKIELHLHIEGTLEPELMFELARRNEVPLRYGSVDEVCRAYAFTDLQSFLDIYYEGARVLQRERDFYDLTFRYLERAHEENVRHAEIFFDPQTHTGRGVSFATVYEGIRGALDDAKERFGISSHLILCFLRDRSAEEAMETFEQALPYKRGIVAVGLDSAERDNPPRKFASVFERAREEGFLTVAHAGEEGPPEYIWEALDMLRVRRVDHGVRCLEDPRLVERLRSEKIPLTVCPLSNVKLRVFDSLEAHNLKQLLDSGIQATVNSDDPAYFGGYITDNFLGVAGALGLERAHIEKLARAAMEGAFLDQARRGELSAELDAYLIR